MSAPPSPKKKEILASKLNPLPVDKWWEDAIFCGMLPSMRMTRREFINHKYFAFLIAGKWSPPCRMFVRALAEAYNKIIEHHGKNELQIVWISMDRDKNSFDEFLTTMPWFAVQFTDEALSRFKILFQPEAIPRLIVYDSKRKLVCQNARGAAPLLGYGCNALESWEYITKSNRNNGHLKAEESEADKKDGGSGPPKSPGGSAKIPSRK